MLSSKAALATEAASDALAAASALQDLDSAGALQLFLSSRCACLLQQLEEGAEALGTAAAANGAVAANGAADGAAAVAAAVTAHQQVLQLLTQLAQSIQTTISQVRGRVLALLHTFLKEICMRSRMSTGQAIWGSAAW